MLTPEHKEEIKKKYKNMDYFTMQHTVGLLLTALEETEKQHAKMKAALEAEKSRGDKWEKAFDNADRQYLKQERASADLLRELAEAQQTIARLTEALEWYAESSNNAVARCALGEGSKETNPPPCPKCGNKNVAEHPTHKDVYLCAPCDRIFGAGEQP